LLVTHENREGLIQAAVIPNPACLIKFLRELFISDHIG